MDNQSGKLKACYETAGITSGSYESAWMQAVEAGYGIVDGTFNERQIVMLQTYLSSTDTEINGLMARAAASFGLASWGDIDYTNMLTILGGGIAPDGSRVTSGGSVRVDSAGNTRTTV